MHQVIDLLWLQFCVFRNGEASWRRKPKHLKLNHNESFFWRQSLTLVTQARVQWILAHQNLCFLGSSDSPASASQVAGITGIHHHTRLIFIFLVETGFLCVGQTGPELLTSGDPPASASQSARINGHV